MDEPLTVAARVFLALCWIPAAMLAGSLAYLTRFSGWGQWAAAQLVLLSMLTSAALTVVGGIEVLAMRRRGRPIATAAAGTLVAAIPLLWLGYRMLVRP